MTNSEHQNLTNVIYPLWTWPDKIITVSHKAEDSWNPDLNAWYNMSYNGVSLNYFQGEFKDHQVSYDGWWSTRNGYGPTKFLDILKGKYRVSITVDQPDTNSTIYAMRYDYDGTGYVWHEGETASVLGKKQLEFEVKHDGLVALMFKSRLETKMVTITDVILEKVEA